MKNWEQRLRAWQLLKRLVVFLVPFWFLFLGGRGVFPPWLHCCNKEADWFCYPKTPKEPGGFFFWMSVITEFGDTSCSTTLPLHFALGKNVIKQITIAHFQHL